MPRLVVLGATKECSRYLSLDIALDKTVMATVTPCWIVKSVQKVCSAVVPYGFPSPRLLQVNLSQARCHHQ